MTPVWTSVLVKARTYQGQQADIVVPGSHTALLASQNADAALIYRIVKAVVDHGRAFGDLHPVVRTSPSTRRDSSSSTSWCLRRFTRAQSATGASVASCARL